MAWVQKSWKVRFLCLKKSNQVSRLCGRGLIGGASVDAHGLPICDETLNQASQADSILFGAVGGPKWDSLPLMKNLKKVC